MIRHSCQSSLQPFAKHTHAANAISHPQFSNKVGPQSNPVTPRLCLDYSKFAESIFWFFILFLVLGLFLDIPSLLNSLPLLIPPSPFFCPLTGQLVAWHPPDALLRTVSMLCFGSVSMPAWQHVGSANPHSVEV